MATVLETERGIDGGGVDSPGLVSDCRLMLSFARKNAFVLAPDLLHEIAWLDSVLKALQMPPVSQMSTRLIWAIDLAKGEPRYLAADPDGEAPKAGTAPAPDAGLAPEEVILDVHARLSTLISPTTALSLQTSEPAPGARHIFGGIPPLVQVVIGIAFVAALCFVVTASRIASKSVNAKAAAAQAASAATAAPAPSAPPPTSPPARAASGAKP